jgi:hypothetical protein
MNLVIYWYLYRPSHYVTLLEYLHLISVSQEILENCTIHFSAAWTHVKTNQTIEIDTVFAVAISNVLAHNFRMPRFKVPYNYLREVDAFFQKFPCGPKETAAQI